jgi:hypothetical protein
MGVNGPLGRATDFVMTVATTGASETFTIPCQNLGVFDATVDWGDGSASAITAFNDADLAHTYAFAGDHQIRISGTFPNIYFNDAGDKLKVGPVLNLGDVGWLGLSGGFRGCINMGGFTAGRTDTSQVVGFDNMFRGVTGGLTIDLTGLSTASANSYSAMFFGSSGIQDIIGVEDFQIESLQTTSRLTNFATSVTLPTARYDALLIKWAAQNPLDGMTPHFGNSEYTAGGLAAAGRAKLISTDGWVIQDGGTA